MASLSELLGETITVQDLMMRLLKTLQQFAPKLTPSQLTIDEILYMRRIYNGLLIVTIKHLA